MTNLEDRVNEQETVLRTMVEAVTGLQTELYNNQQLRLTALEDGITKTMTLILGRIDDIDAVLADVNSRLHNHHLGHLEDDPAVVENLVRRG